MYKKAELKAYKWKKYPNKEQFNEIKQSLNIKRYGQRLASSAGTIFNDDIKDMYLNKFPCIIFVITFYNKGVEKDYYENLLIDIWEKLDQYLVIDLNVTDIHF